MDAPSIRTLKLSGLSYREIASQFNCTERTIYRKRKSRGGVNGYDSMTDEELDETIISILQSIPNCGAKYLLGALKSKGYLVQRQRVRDSLNRVDPQGVQNCKKGAVIRRTYSTPHPRYIWHIDGCHTMIKWRLVIHGGIDGFSRFVPFLHCSPNNRSTTVASLFKQSVEEYGIPFKIRIDAGVENYGIAAIMDQSFGDPSCVLVGSSVHNQRIERFWRDVTSHVSAAYKVWFESLEEAGCLDPLSECDLLALHVSYLPMINKSLEDLRNAHNFHINCSESASPIVMFMRQHLIGEETLAKLNIASENFKSLDVGSNLSQRNNEGVVVPNSRVVLSEDAESELVTIFDAINPEQNFGLDRYLAVRKYLEDVVMHS